MFLVSCEFDTVNQMKLSLHYYSAHNHSHLYSLQTVTNFLKLIEIYVFIET